MLFSELPDPVLCDVFELLPLPDRLQLSSVSSRFHRETSATVHSLKINLAKDIPAKILGDLKSRFPNIFELALKNPTYAERARFNDVLLDTSWQLRSIFIDFTTGLFAEKVFRSHSCANLEHVVFSDIRENLSSPSDVYRFGLLSRLPQSLKTVKLVSKTAVPLEMLKRAFWRPMHTLSILDIRQPSTPDFESWMAFLDEVAPMLPSLRFIPALKACPTATTVCIATLKERRVASLLERHPPFADLFKTWGWQSFCQTPRFSCQAITGVVDSALSADLVRAVRCRDHLLFSACVEALRRLVLEGGFSPSFGAIAARKKAIDVICSTLPSLVAPSPWQKPRHLHTKAVSALVAVLSESRHVVCSMGLICHLERSAMLTHGLLHLIQTKSSASLPKKQAFADDIFRLCCIKGLRGQMQGHFADPSDSSQACRSALPPDFTRRTGDDCSLLSLSGDGGAAVDCTVPEREPELPSDDAPTEQQLATDIATVVCRLGSGACRDPPPLAVLRRVNALLQLVLPLIMHSDCRSLGALKAVTSVLLERVPSSPAVQKLFFDAVATLFPEWKKTVAHSDYLPVLLLLLEAVPDEELASRLDLSMVQQAIRFLTGDACSFSTPQIIRFVAVTTNAPDVVQQLLTKGFFSKYFRSTAVARSPSACVAMLRLALKSMVVGRKDRKMLNTLVTQLREKPFNGVENFSNHCSVVGKAVEVLAAMQRHATLSDRERKLLVVDKALMLLHNLYNPPPPEREAAKKKKPKQLPSLDTALQPNGAYATEQEFVGAVLRAVSELLSGGKVPVGQRQKYCLAVLLAVQSAGSGLPLADAAAAMRLLGRAKVSKLRPPAVEGAVGRRVRDGMRTLLLALGGNGLPETKTPEEESGDDASPVSSTKRKVPTQIGLPQIGLPFPPSTRVAPPRAGSIGKPKPKKPMTKPKKPMTKPKKRKKPMTEAALAQVERRWARLP